MIGPGQSATFSGRTISWDFYGIAIEGGNKYIDTLVKGWDIKENNALKTPGCDEDKRQGGGDEELERIVSRYRAFLCLLLRFPRLFCRPL